MLNNALQSPHRSINCLLASMGPALLERLAPHFSRVDLRRGEALFESGGSIEFAYFPHSCVISLVSVMQEGGTAETATIGREGAVGLLASQGDWTMFHRCIVQVPGAAERIGLKHLRSAVAESDTLQDLLQRYGQALLGQVMQSVACNALHPVEARLCRWLLMNRDRCDSDVLPLTHEFLAEMLGVQRATVTLVARTLQTAGLIQVQRGSIGIRDREGLEECSCECYGIIRQHFERVMPGGLGPCHRPPLD